MAGLVPGPLHPSAWPWCTLSTPPLLAPKPSSSDVRRHAQPPPDMGQYVQLHTSWLTAGRTNHTTADCLNGIRQLALGRTDRPCRGDRRRTLRSGGMWRGARSPWRARSLPPLLTAGATARGGRPLWWGSAKTSCAASCRASPPCTGAAAAWTPCWVRPPFHPVRLSVGQSGSLACVTGSCRCHACVACICHAWHGSSWLPGCLLLRSRRPSSFLEWSSPCRGACSTSAVVQDGAVVGRQAGGRAGGRADGWVAGLLDGWIGG